MLIKPDCIPCVLRMAVTAMRALNLDESRGRSLYRRIADLPGLRGELWNLVSPDLIEDVMKIIVKTMESSDPFRLLKWKQNKRALEVESYIKSLIEEDADPLHGAVRLAILGNMIDLMVPESPRDFMNWIRGKLQDPISAKAYQVFRERLKRSNLVAYLGDNAGEIVFDKCLIEVIRERFDVEVIYVVRSMPTLNDVTLAEALQAGMDETAQIVENGIDGPYPGTVINRCSETMQEVFRKADLIISKGGGNFDSFGEEAPEITQKTTFMLLSKCQPYCDIFGTGLFQPVLTGFP